MKQEMAGGKILVSMNVYPFITILTATRSPGGGEATVTGVRTSWCRLYRHLPQFMEVALLLLQPQPCTGADRVRAVCVCVCSVKAVCGCK